MPDDAYEARIGALLDNDPPAAAWLGRMRSFAKDMNGLTIILGLSPEETEEFLRLGKIVGLHMPNGDPEFDRQEERFHALLDRHNAARQRDALENLPLHAGEVQKH
jgi:hypothetical protein